MEIQTQKPDTQLQSSMVSRKAFDIAEEILEVDGSTTTSASSSCTRCGSPRTCLRRMDSDLELESIAGWSSPASPFSTVASPGRWASWLDIDSVLRAVEAEQGSVTPSQFEQQVYPFAPSLSTKSAVCSYPCYEDETDCSVDIEAAVSPASMPVSNTMNMSMLMQLAERSGDHFCGEIPLQTSSPDTDGTSTAHFVLQNSRIPLLPLHHPYDAPSLLSARQQPTSPTLARFSRDGSTVGHTARSLRVEDAGSDVVFVQYGDASPDMQEFSSGAASPAAFVGLLLQNDEEEVDNERITRAIRRMLGLESQVDATVQLLRLTETEIQSLPKVRFSSAEEEQCAICLESFQEDEVLTSLRCGHFFHVQCATLWMQQATHCPLCRRSCIQ